MTIDESAPTRERLLAATIELMRTKGAAASGTKEILELARAPRGSFYFHFPDGKDELVREAMQQAAADTLDFLLAGLADDTGDLAAQVQGLFDAIADDLFATDYAAGCAVGVTTLESSSVSPEFQGAVDGAFGSWTAALTTRLVDRGVDQEQAPGLADLIVAAQEGATMLARAHRDPAPLRNAGRLMATTVRALTAP